jgi:C1A family cysteine protease
MRLLVSFLLFAFVLCKVNAQNPAWEAYKLQYGYVFDSVEEDQKREAIWADSLNKLVSNQKKFAVGGEIPSFKLGQNKFSLYTYDEKVAKFTGLTREAREHRRRMFDVKQAGKTSRRPTTTRRVTTSRRVTTTIRPTTSRRPTTTRRVTTTVQINTNSSVDWRNTPLVGPVKNQGSCG